MKPGCLVVEFFDDANWLGGSVYIENLLSLLTLLPAQERPRVRLQLLGEPVTPMARRLLEHPIFEGRAAQGNGATAALVRRVHRAVLRRAPWLGALFAAPGDEVVFPAFDATQRWRRNLFWIPDFQHRHLPELFDAAEIAWRERCYAEIARTPGLLLLSSEVALGDFRSFYPQATVKPRVWSFCSTVPVGPASDCAPVLARHGLPGRFLYVANQFWRHKDHATLFEALRLLRERGLEVPLVCTGRTEDRRDPAYFPELERQLEAGGLRGQVKLLGVLPREEQLAIFRSAAAVVQPSRFEGWSVVVEDAKALGRPVIASDIAVHREQLDGVPGAVLFPVSDAARLAECIAVSWPLLAKGPDTECERRAAEAASLERREAAKQFVAIVEEALAFPATGHPA